MLGVFFDALTKVGGLRLAVWGLCNPTLRFLAILGVYPQRPIMGLPFTMIVNGTLRTCMHACPPMSARRSNHAPSFLTFRPGMVSPHTKDLPA